MKKIFVGVLAVVAVALAVWAILAKNGYLAKAPGEEQSQASVPQIEAQEDDSISAINNQLENINPDSSGSPIESEINSDINGL